MRIKKVEISGFRAFNKVEDATFNFELDDDKTANLISIYAPNGFGKTSFYDAVEWCMTDQIERFHKNALEYTKSALENRKSNSKNPYFLRHNNLDKKTPAFVKIITETDEFPRALPKSKTYDFKSIGERIYFKDVMLSQELIDSFMKEVKAEHRYSSFVESFSDLKAYNTKLQNIEILISHNESPIKKLELDIKGQENKQLSIDYENDGKVLEEINKYIQLIKDKKHSISLINKDTFTDNDFKVLSNSIQSQLSQLPIEIETKKSRIGNIDITYNGIEGDDKNNGIVVYFDNKRKTVLIEMQLNNYRKLLKLNLGITEANSNIEQNQIKITEALKIRDLFPDYLLIENKVKANNDAISGLETKIRDVKESLIKPQENLTEFGLKIEKSKIALRANDTKQKNIEPTKKRIGELKLKIDKIGKQKDIESSILKKETEIKNQKLEAVGITQLIEDMKEAPQNLLNNSKLDPYQKDIQDVVKLEEANKLNKAKLESILIRIEEQKNFNKEMLEFVSNGLDIVVKHENNVCPLCSKQYASFSELSEKIRSNKALDKHLQQILDQKTELDLLIASNYKEITKKKDIVITVLTNLKKVKFDSINDLSNELFALSESKKQIDSFEKEIKELQLFFEGSDEVKFLKKLEEEQKNLNDIIINLSKEKDSLEIKIKGEENKVKTYNDAIEDKNTENNAFKTDEKYLTVIKYFNSILNTETIDKTLVENEISRLQSEVKSARMKTDEFKQEASAIRTQLSIDDISIDNIKTIIKQQEKVLLLNQKTTQNYEQVVKSEFNIDLTLLDKDEADKQFTELKQKIRHEQLELEELLKYYKIVNDLKDQTMSFINAIKTQNEIIGLKKQLKNKQKVNEFLNKEKDKLQAFLKKRINDFFQTELINSIYKKIDPHPDYTDIKFDCDFKGSSPRLQIYTTDKKGNSSVPSLYFSSAQINILSLSIFLARALTAVNPNTNELIECIFIDDPIQSMDSINILSFIDLFRSLTVNLNRQIILSTHEENFHLLLQKKIPQKLFQSKFIQFETFGKLEKNASSIN
ncbi:AAA family ATPase [Maribellus sediminis]|uniref:AAA family ATPase n=1 Tax=Maribellus sediminis TaxID=2696285 RepID=UPI00143075DA|nr:AAA family ATPase [Maribellus sediminis]